MIIRNIAETLNMLVQTCNDSAAGFQVALEAVDDENLKHLFSSCSRQRAAFSEDLQQLVELYSCEDPPQSSSVAGALHRGWIHLRKAVTDGGNAPILSECERGEDAAVRNYEDALEKDLPPGVRAVVYSQYLCIVDTHGQIRELRDALKTVS